ncbi:MAG: sulfatase-like hydrolase/transferase [Planctomycetota bacterium]
MMSLRSIFFFVTLLCLSGTTHCFVHGQERPNIVLVMCDDLGWGDVGFNGGTTIKTPHLDEMAKHSLQFNRFYAQAPVCSPTRGSCLTGRHPYRYGIPTANSGHMKKEELTLAELLKKLGYATGHFGKWHLGTLTTTVQDANRGGPRNKKNYSPPQDNGFDVCFSTESKVPTFDPMIKPKGAKAGGHWDAITDKSQAETYGTYYWNEQGEQVQDNLEGDDSKLIMDRASRFIEAAAAADRPFFVVVWFHTPHLPVVADAEHRAMYPDAESVLAANYYGCVTAMDEQIGRLRETLKKVEAHQNTLVTFCSDNGPEGKDTAPGSAAHFRGRKRSLYEGGVRVPGLIEWPAKIEPGVTDFPAVTSDYLPTILDHVGAVIDDDRPIDGISLKSVFLGQQMERARPIGFQSAKQQALSGDRYKIYRDGKAKWELYDLLKDPSESKDIAGQHPEVVARMGSYFESWKKSCSQSNEGLDY